MKEEIERIKKAVQAIADGAFGSAHDLPKIVFEILNPPKEDEFLECDTCRAKAGSPILCKGCLHNRTLIENLKK